MPQKRKKNMPNDRMTDYDFDDILPAEAPYPHKKKIKSHTLTYIVCALLTIMLAMAAYVYFQIYRPMTRSVDPGASFNGDDALILDEDLIVTKDDLIYVDPNDLSPNMGLGEETINILLLGVDGRTANKFDGLSDTMIILSVNPKTNDVKMTSVMRDTLVTIPGRTKQQKINAANVFGGPNLAIKTVNEVFDMNINDYVAVNFQSVIEIVNFIGGIDLDITEKEMAQINENLNGYRGDLIAMGAPYDEKDFKYLKKFGEGIHLNGHQALAYARIRKIDSDYMRAERQRKVITTVAEKAANGNIFTVGGLAAQLFPYVSTSLGLQEIVSLATIAMNADLHGVEELQIPAPGTFQSGMQNGVWSIRPDFAKNKRILKDFIYGAEREEP